MPRVARVLRLTAGSDAVHSATADEFRTWLEAQTTVAVDVETASLEWDATVRLVQFGNRDEGYAVDPRGDGLTILRRVFAAPALRQRLVFHNAPFDVRALARVGIDSDTVWPRATDTYITAHVLAPAAPHDLDSLNRAVNPDSGTDGYKKAFRDAMRKRKWTWANVPLIPLATYGIRDTVATWRIDDALTRQLDQTEREVVARERKVSRRVWDVGQRGMKLDRRYAVSLDTRMGADIADLRRQLARYPLAPGEIATDDGRLFVEDPVPERLTNPNAIAQIARALVAQGWEPAERTAKSGAPKLDKATLEALEGVYPLAALVLEYRRLNKWRTAYVRSCIVASARSRDSRVHASYNSLGARTGRMACSNPPLQQLPSRGSAEIRRLFIAEPGHVIASVDYSAVEFRLAGALSGESRILDVYRAGGDWYAQVATDLGITRPEAKVFVLAITYGAQGKRIGLALSVSKGRGDRLVREFWRRYPTLKRWLEKLESDARDGIPPRSMWGRRLQPHAPYAAGNAAIQGTAAEVMKDGLLRLHEADLDRYVVALVHDEAVLELPERDADSLVAQVAAVMTDSDTFACPLVAEGKVYGRSWGDGY